MLGRVHHGGRKLAAAAVVVVAVRIFAVEVAVDREMGGLARTPPAPVPV